MTIQFWHFSDALAAKKEITNPADLKHIYYDYKACVTVLMTQKKKDWLK